MKKFFSFMAAALFAGSMMAATYNKTAYANLKTGDVVIITEQKNDDVYAASNDQGTAKPPVATAVTVADDAITTDATNILWTVEKDGDNISFLAGETYLYCTSTNNGVRVGTNANKVFSIDATSGYLYNNATSRYIGVYNGADWRCYTSVNSNITGQTLGFYVLAQEQGGEGGDDPQPATRTIYLNGGGSSLWNQADAVFFAHAWGGTGVDVKMTLVEGDVYSVAIPSDNTSLLFVRMAPGSEAINWDTKWNQSADQTIPADKDLFTMTDWSNGTWSVYGETPEPPTPVEAAYYLVGTMNNWQAAEDYKFAAAETEGEFILHTTLAVDDEIKVIKVEGETTTWYPAVGGNYVVDAAHAGEKDIYFRPAGNEAWAEFGGYIWMGENQPAPVADFTQPFTLKFNGTGESGKDNSAAFAADVAAIFDAASAPYVASVETATKVYAGRPIADDNSSVKFGTSSAQGSLSFTLAQAIEVDSIIVNATQYGNNAAKVTVNGVEFNLTAGNKVPTDCKITPEGKVSAITIEQTGSERIYLRYITVYAKTSTTPGKEGYALLVNGTDLIDLTHGEEYEGYDQWFVEGAALKAGDVVKVHNYATEASWAIGILNPASSKHVANSEDGLVFDKDGEYTIYLKLKFEADEIYVAPLPDEGGDEPGEKIENPIFTVIVPEGTDSVFVAGSFDEWASFRKLSAVEGKDNQFTIQIEGEFEAIEYKYLAGPDWKYVEVREGDANRTFVVDALDEVSAWTSVPEGGEEPPTPGKEGYALLVNGTDLIDLTHGEEYEGYDQWFVEGAALKAGDVVKVHSYETEASWAIGILNPASSKHVANSEEGLVFDQDGEYTIYLKLKFEADEIYVAPLADEGGDPVLTDGYYLVGSFSDWKAAAENLFVANPDAEGEYQLAINLTAGDEIKVAYVVADVLTEWFPKEGNYIVDANHSGATTMYFRPDYKEEWAAFGGYFYIVPTSTEGIEEILSEGKAVKVLHEGKLLIMKGSHSYTPMGQIVK